MRSYLVVCLLGVILSCKDSKEGSVPKADFGFDSFIGKEVELKDDTEVFIKLEKGHIREIMLSNLNIESDLDSLIGKNASTVEYLSIEGSRLGKLNINTLKNVVFLDIRNSSLPSLPIIKDLKKLRRLSLAGLGLRGNLDASLLPESVVSLNLTGNRLSRISNISKISDLSTIYVNYNYGLDVSFLYDLKSLEFFYCKGLSNEIKNNSLKILGNNYEFSKDSSFIYRINIH